MIELFNEDCMEGMKRYPDNHFELAICDPPYGIDINKSGRLVREKGWNYKNWDKDSPRLTYFTQLQRICKNWIIWGANHFIKEFPLEMQNTSCWLIWDKKQPQGVSFASAELAHTSFTSTVKTFYLHPQGEKRIHPTQKPVKLYEWLLKNYAKEGDKILDTHGGSMSIAIACHNMKHDLVLFEIDKDYFTGKARLEEHQKQGTMF